MEYLYIEIVSLVDEHNLVSCFQSQSNPNKLLAIRNPGGISNYWTVDIFCYSCGRFDSQAKFENFNVAYFYYMQLCLEHMKP